MRKSKQGKPKFIVYVRHIITGVIKKEQRVESKFARKQLINALEAKHSRFDFTVRWRNA